MDSDFIRERRPPGAACGCPGAGARFMSKKMKIRQLESCLNNMREKAQDIEEYIRELKEGN